MYNFTINDVDSYGNFNDNVLSVVWSLVEYCNYQCSYCSAKSPSIKDSNQYIDYNNIIKIFDKLFSLKRDKYIIGLAGGEPTLHPNFLDIINYLNNSNQPIQVYIMTNGTKDLNFFENVFKLSSNIDFGLCISLHMEYYNNNKLEYYEKLIDICNKYKVNIEFKLLFHPEYENESKIVFETFTNLMKDKILNLRVHFIFDKNNNNKIDSRYTNDHINCVNNMNMYLERTYDDPYKYHYMYGKNEYRLKNNDLIHIDHSRFGTSTLDSCGLRNFKNMYCCLATKAITVDHKGYVSGVGCYGFRMYPLYDDNFEILDLFEYIKCPYERCACPTDDLNVKFRNENEAINYIQKYKIDTMKLMLKDNIKKINEITTKYENNNIKLNKLIDSIAWWIPIKKLRDSFRNKSRPDQTRPDQTRPDQTRPDHIR